MNHVTLDGVMQGPGRPDEDTSGGFTHGGWAVPGTAEAPGTAMSERMTAGGGLAGWLFGRRTYEGLLERWAREPESPFGPALVNTPKWVASTTLTEPMPWPNSTLLSGDVPSAVADVKERVHGVLAIMGSSRLIESLLPHRLIDEFLLFVHPLVLGSGKRLFPSAEQPVALRLVNAVTSSTGVIVARYEPAAP
jgi:dihydrofolate reductase